MLFLLACYDQAEVIPIGLGINLWIDSYNSAKLCVNMDNREKWGYLSTGVWITFLRKESYRIWAKRVF